MKVSNRHYQMAGLSIIILGLAIILVNWLFWEGLSSSGQAGMIASSIGGMGTLVLAAATLISIKQQAATIEDLQKEREKPLVIDEIQHTIQYALKGATQNHQIFEDPKRDFSWRLAEGPANHRAGLGPKAVIDKDPDLAAQSRFRRNSPDLWVELVEYENLIRESAEIGDSIVRKLRPEVEKFVENNAIERKVESRADINTLIDAAIEDVDEFGDSHSLHDYWEEHGDSLKELTTEIVGAELRELEEKKDILHEKSFEVVQALENRRAELRREYGISSDELDVEEIEYPLGI